MKYKIIAICGKSAAGKDTLLHKMVECRSDIHEIVSCTTRPPREGEQHGINYFFCSPDEFKAKYYNNELLEVSEFRGWGYGTSLDGLDASKINVGVFNPTGIFNLMNDERVDLFVIQVIATDKIRLLRSLRREENPDVDEIVRRYLTDKEDFENFAKFYEPDYIVENNGEGIAIDRAITVTDHIIDAAMRAWANQTN